MCILLLLLLILLSIFQCYVHGLHRCRCYRRPSRLVTCYRDVGCRHHVIGRGLTDVPDEVFCHDAWCHRVNIVIRWSLVNLAS